LPAKGFRRAKVWPQLRDLPGSPIFAQNVELVLDIADHADVLDQGAVVYHAAASELLADKEIRERCCSV
jgi:ABC-type branched-subunit amino acid transport system ATPase component